MQKALSFLRDYEGLVEGQDDLQQSRGYARLLRTRCGLDLHAEMFRDVDRREPKAGSNQRSLTGRPRTERQVSESEDWY